MAHATIAYYERAFIGQCFDDRQDVAWGTLYAGHGPEFVERYIDLLVHNDLVNRTRALRLAGEHGVRVADADWYVEPLGSHYELHLA